MLSFCLLSLKQNENYKNMLNTLNIHQCPNCKESVIIDPKDIRCGKFVHAIYKTNMKPVNPHSKPSFIQKLIKSNKVYGCGSFFTLNKIQT